MNDEEFVKSLLSKQANREDNVILTLREYLIMKRFIEILFNLIENKFSHS